MNAFVTLAVLKKINRKRWNDEPEQDNDSSHAGVREAMMLYPLFPDYPVFKCP